MLQGSLWAKEGVFFPEESEKVKVKHEKSPCKFKDLPINYLDFFESAFCG